eukprot:gene10685-19453_t
MAGDVVAAFRTVVLFISFSWLSVMYLLVYRVPRLEREGCNHYQVIEGGLKEKTLLRRYEDSFLNDGEIKIFGEDLPEMGLNLANPTKIAESGSLNLPSKNLKIPKSIKRDSKEQPVIPVDKNIDFVSNVFNCTLLESMRTFEVLGSGYTKVVRRGILGGTSYALKYTTSKNQDIIKCKSERPSQSHFECYNLAKFKLLKEALLMNQLQHRNIIKVFGACPWTSNDIEGSESVLTVVTELGKPLDVIKMIQIPWDVRLQMAIHLVELLIYLDQSPLGPLVIKDFRIEQLVIKDDVIKLSDLDDIDGRHQSCQSRNDCFVGGAITNSTLPCTNNRCTNFASTINLYNLYKIFLDYSFNYENPRLIGTELKLIADEIVSFRIDLKTLLDKLQRVTWRIQKGVFARELIKQANSEAKKVKFDVFADATILGPNYDYYCLESRSLSTCEFAVWSIKEAKALCAMSRECKAFVIIPQRNWLGQMIVTLKNSGRNLTPVTKHTTYVRLE